MGQTQILKERRGEPFGAAPEAAGCDSGRGQAVTSDPSISVTSATVRDAGTTAADALFASSLQPSDDPTPGQARQAIAAAVTAYSGRGCSARVAQAYGDHPDTAGTRMRWARTLAARALPASGWAA